MIIHFDDFRPRRRIYLPFLDRLNGLYADMDTGYRRAAAHYGFECAGCSDNCCLTTFYHHALAEYLGLLEGLDTLDPGTLSGVRDRAGQYRTCLAEHSPGSPLRMMCPLNTDGRCLTYTQRPMICRLHGIAHELHRPGHRPVRGPGCEAFQTQCGQMAYRPFDRTPYYRQMAQLESELRQRLGFKAKIKLTVADMIVAH